jgi:hypothetical protein
MTQHPTPRPGALRVGVLGVLVTVLGLALSGCGIRDTALPVDAGVAASRTACPPAPDATLSKLAAAESILPTAGPLPVVPGGPERTAAADAKAKTAERQAEQDKLSEQEKLKTRPTAEATPQASPTVSAAPGASAAPTAPVPNASDGTLVCSPPIPTSSVTASP